MCTDLTPHVLHMQSLKLRSFAEKSHLFWKNTENLRKKVKCASASHHILLYAQLDVQLFVDPEKLWWKNWIICIFWKNTKIKGENYMGIFLHILFTHLNFMPFVDPEKTVLTKSHPATQPHTQLVQSLHSAKTDVTWITTKMNTFIIMHISAVQYNNMMKMVNDCWRLVTMSNKQHYTVNHLTTTSHTLRCNDMAHSSTNLNWLNHQQ